MFNAVTDGFQKALAEPCERLFALLGEIRDSIAQGVALVAEIHQAVVVAIDPGEDKE